MDDSLHYLIMANQMLVQRGLLERLKETGLTIGQPKVLDYLKEHDGSNQKEIARACFLEAGSLTSILNRMEEKGLVERRMLNGNRRSFHVFLTENGKKNQEMEKREVFMNLKKKKKKKIRNWWKKCLRRLRKMHWMEFHQKNLKLSWKYIGRFMEIFYRQNERQRKKEK